MVYVTNHPTSCDELKRRHRKTIRGGMVRS